MIFIAKELFAELEADEAVDGEGVADFFALSFEETLNGGVGVLNEALLEEAVLGVELAKLSADDFFENVSRLVLSFHLLAEDVLLGFDEVGRDVFASESGRSGSGDVKSEVLDEVAEGIIRS